MPAPRKGGRETPPPESLVARVRGEYFEMLGLRVTLAQACRLWQSTRTPLPTWFRAMWWVTSQKTGASALGLRHVLGLDSYETAWTWLHKLHRAMVRSGRDGRGRSRRDALGGGRRVGPLASDREGGHDRSRRRGARARDWPHPAAADPATSVPPSSLSSSRLGTTSSVSPAPTRQPPR
jgi:hypothetical protein